jgi:hypothetical protein
MGGCYKIDIVAPPPRKLEHHGCNLFRFNIYTLFQVADIIVLAKTAEEIAGADENGARTMSSHQRRFLTKMGIIAGNSSLPPGFAVTQLAFQAVHLALARTEAA